MIKKWLLVLNAFGEVDIIEREMSYHVPINRMLDKAGFYALDSIKINETIYLLVFDENEMYVKKTKMLVTKIGFTEEGEGTVSLGEEDRENVYKIIKAYMKIKKECIN